MFVLLLVIVVKFVWFSITIKSFINLGFVSNKEQPLPGGGRGGGEEKDRRVGGGKALKCTKSTRNRVRDIQRGEGTG